MSEFQREKQVVVKREVGEEISHHNKITGTKEVVHLDCRTYLENHGLMRRKHLSIISKSHNLNETKT